MNLAAGKKLHLTDMCLKNTTLDAYIDLQLVVQSDPHVDINWVNIMMVVDFNAGWHLAFTILVREEASKLMSFLMA